MNELTKNEFEFSDNLKTNKIAFTIVSKNYLHYALTVRNSFLKYNKDYGFIIFILDMVNDCETLSTYQELNKKGVDIRCFLAIQKHINVDLNQMLINYDILEMNTAIKPFVIEYLFKENYEKVIYLDPDIYFKNKITKVENLLNDFDIILTPHITKEYPDDIYYPNHQSHLKTGIYNLGFLALKNTQNSLGLVHWWQNKLFDKCYADFFEHFYVDQKWMDYAPSIFDKVFIFKDSGYNVAYWNLHERSISIKNNEFYVNNEPLVFYHFSGFNIDNYKEITRQNRYKLDDLGAGYQKIFEEYNEKIKQFRGGYFSDKPYYFDCYTLSNEKLGFKRAKRFVEQQIWLAKKYSVFMVIGRLFKFYKKIKKAAEKASIEASKNSIGFNIFCEGNIARQSAEFQYFYQSLLTKGIPFSIININSLKNTKQIFSKNIFFVEKGKLENLLRNKKYLFKSKENYIGSNLPLNEIKFKDFNFKEIKTLTDLCFTF